MKNKILTLFLITLLIVASCSFVYTIIDYIKIYTKSTPDTTSITISQSEDSSIIQVDEDSSIKIIKEYDENMFKGKKSLVFFWASWCSHCREEYEVVKTAIADYQNRGYNIYLVSHDYTELELSEFMKDNDLNYEVYFDEQRVIRAHFDPEASSVPLTYIIDENANLIDSHNGTITLEELNALIDKNM